MKYTEFKVLWTVFFFLVAFSQPLFGNEVSNLKTETGLQKQININDALNYAYKNNPSIQSAKESWKASIEKYRIQTGYPDPTLMVTYFPSPIETRLGPQEWNLNLSQAIPFPGKLTQKGKVIESGIRADKLKLDKTIKKVTLDIVTSYQELVYIQKAIHFANANDNLTQELLKLSENAYADDRSSLYDVSKARAQISQIQYDILLLKELEQTEKIKLNTLLNRSPSAPLGTAKSLKIRNNIYSIDDLLTLFVDTQENILIANEKIVQSNEKITLAKLNNLPSFKLGLFYAGIGEPDVAKPPADAGKDAIGIQFGMNIPLWFGKNSGKTQKAISEKRKAIYEKTKISNQARANISRTWFKLQNSKRLISLYKNNLIPQAIQSVQTAETWFREGEGSFSDFLEVQATAYNFQLSLERAKADYTQAFAKLELLTGIPLDQKDATLNGGQS